MAPDGESFFSARARPKVLHIITGLDVGGAESMLYKLVSTTAQESEVISLTDTGLIADRLKALEVPVRALNFRWFRAPLDLLRLVGWIRSSKADIVQTWMYHSDVIGGVAARLAGKSGVAWNIRASPFDGLSDLKWTTVAFIRLSAILSRMIPARIICCSESAQEIHKGFGYAARKMVIIPNGFDLEQFRPDVDARRSVREELGLSMQSPIVGLVARYDPMKDHALFFRAATIVAAQHPEVHFVLIGKGVTLENDPLIKLIPPSLRHRVHLLGLRMDAARLMAAFDVAVSSSSAEGFPNVVGEAMACAVPCVVTDVGDSAAIVGSTGLVVRPGDTEGLALGITSLLLMDADQRRRLGTAARERVAGEFALPVIVRRYEEFYWNLATRS
ncbi:MAG: glycosyltransferase [Acidobacteriota bacterium]